MATKIDAIRASPTEELLLEEEFDELFDRERHPRTYIGFEISGQVHLGTGILSMSKVKDFLEAGFDCTVFLADWHSWLNGKLGGDLETIRDVAGGYFKEGLRIGLRCVGTDSTPVRFVMGSEVYDQEYWATVVKVSKALTVKRVQRMITIMGRKEGEAVNFAQLVYPPMQIADIFHLDVNVAHGGMDQRKAHVGAREVAEKIGKAKPLALHHHLLAGLKGPAGQVPTTNLEQAEIRSELKMSKSKPDSAIFIHDSQEVIHQKLDRAYCPPREIEYNPVIDIAEYVILPILHKITIERSEKHGGDAEIPNAAELRSQYSNGNIHPMDLKQAVANTLTEILGPARSYFASHPELLRIFDQTPDVKEPPANRRPS